MCVDGKVRHSQESASGKILRITLQRIISQIVELKKPRSQTKCDDERLTESEAANPLGEMAHRHTHYSFGIIILRLRKIQLLPI